MKALYIDLQKCNRQQLVSLLEMVSQTNNALDKENRCLVGMSNDRPKKRVRAPGANGFDDRATEY